MHMRSFVKIEPSRIGEITLSITDTGKSCPVSDFNVANVSFNAVRENKILAKISEFTVFNTAPLHRPQSALQFVHSQVRMPDSKLESSSSQSLAQVP